MHDLKLRTQTFAVEVLHEGERLPVRTSVQLVAKQVMRSATSVAANYRAATCARSRAEFIAKLCIVEEEADETVFWMEMLSRMGFDSPAWDRLRDEARQLLAIVVASKKTAKQRLLASR